MTADEARAADTRAWIARADADVRGAEVDLRADPPLLGDAVFHAQQAAEKGMKALLAWHDVPFRKTHDLAVLGEVCAGVEPALDTVLRAAAPLTQYAWKFRYPGEPIDPPRREADEALALARTVVDAVRRTLVARGMSV